MIIARFSQYEINIQNSIVFLHTNNEQLEFEVNNTVSFTLAPRKQNTQAYKSNKMHI